MLRAQIAFLLTTPVMFAAGFSGASAFEYTRRAVDLGPRPSGTAANLKLQAMILDELKKRGAQVSEDAFTATTPQGQIAMKNIIAKFPGASGRAIAVTGHFDTKYFPNNKFVGASDGASSTGLLLELARVAQTEKRIDDLYIVFFDGEEAFHEWSDTDKLYGSRHLAERWKAEGMLPKIKALINVDMIGDKNLDLQPDTNSSVALRKLVWQTASDLGFKSSFSDDPIDIDDDHMPFLRMGVPSVDLIDFDYPAWHKNEDTLDKLSPQSLEIVGSVVVEVIHRLEK
jgi:Zn-dependent M28 family amino/carboxypeptidase